MKVFFIVSLVIELELPFLLILVVLFSLLEVLLGFDLLDGLTEDGEEPRLRGLSVGSEGAIVLILVVFFNRVFSCRFSINPLSSVWCCGLVEEFRLFPRSVFELLFSGKSDLFPRCPCPSF